MRSSNRVKRNRSDADQIDTRAVQAWIIESAQSDVPSLEADMRHSIATDLIELLSGAAIACATFTFPGPHRARPGFAPVCSPSFKTCTPFTKTCFIPTAY